MWLLCVYVATIELSNVARGGDKWCYSPPIGLKSMQNSVCVFSVLRLIFALKTKIAPPPNEVGVRVGEDREIMMTSRSGCQYTWRPFFFFWRSLDFGQKNALNFGEDLFLDRKTFWITAKTFFFYFLFWRSLDFGQKNTPNFGEDLFFSFFWRSPGFHWTIASIQFKTNENSGQVSFTVEWNFKKSPPFAKSWLRNW